MTADDAQGSPAPLRVGYKASAEQFSPRELVDLTVAAEEHGLDSVWVSDHFQPWRDTGGHAPSSLAFLGAAAASTQRVVLGTSVLTPTLRYNPAVLAQYFATLACLAPERVVLGVGTGEAMNEHAVSGQAFPAFKERSSRLRESIDVMRRLWSGERVSHSGEHYTTVDAKLYDLPEHPVPVHIAAGGPVMAKWAGRLGDGLICTSGKGMGLYVDELLPACAAGLEASDAPLRPYERVIEIKISYDRDPAKAVAATRFWAPLSLTAEQKHGLADAREIERAADALPDEQVARRWIIASDPETALQQIRPYVEAGLTHLVVHAPGHDQMRFLDQFSQDVLAPLRELQQATTAATAPVTAGA